MSIKDELEDELLKEIVNSARQIGFKATNSDKNSLIKFYNEKIEIYLSNSETGDIFKCEDLFFLIDAYIFAELADCRDSEKCKKISKKIINKIFKKIRSENIKQSTTKNTN
jgi:hypothetical protein